MTKENKMPERIWDINKSNIEEEIKDIKFVLNSLVSFAEHMALFSVKTGNVELAESIEDWAISFNRKLKERGDEQ